MTEKSVFREAWGPELTSQSFPVSCLVSRFCTPPEVKFDAFGTSKHGKGKSLWQKLFLLYLSVHWGEGKSLSKFFLLHLSAHWGDLIEQIRKKSVIYTVSTPISQK